jgi:hypothetical protein
MISPFFGLEECCATILEAGFGDTLRNLLLEKAPSFSVVVPILTRFHGCNIYWRQRIQR